jgi:hypothetical protein
LLRVKITNLENVPVTPFRGLFMNDPDLTIIKEALDKYKSTILTALRPRYSLSNDQYIFIDLDDKIKKLYIYPRDEGSVKINIVMNNGISIVYLGILENLGLVDDHSKSFLGGKRQYSKRSVKKRTTRRQTNTHKRGRKTRTHRRGRKSTKKQSKRHRQRTRKYRR